MTRQPATREASPARRVQDLGRHIADLAVTRGRKDFASLLQDDGPTTRRLEVALIVVGETGQGKTSVVNSLLGTELLPVGADTTTATRTIVRYSRDAGARVYRRDGTMETVPPSGVGAYVALEGTSDQDNPVAFAEIGLPDRLLSSGLVLVDTPGVGGLVSAHAAITLAALSQADALLFVTDAGSPLTRPELAFLEQATKRIGVVIFALTKIDAFAGWQSTLAENQALLGAHAPVWKSAPFVGLSSRAALEARRAREIGDQEFAERLTRQSGYAELEAILGASVVRRGAMLRLRNQLQFQRTVLTELEGLDRQALAAADGDPILKSQLAGATERRREFLDHKRVGTVALVDEFTLLNQHVRREFNRMMADLRTQYEADIRSNKLKPESIDEAFDADLQAACAKLGRFVAERVEAIARHVRDELQVSVASDGAKLSVDPELSVPSDSGVQRDPVGQLNVLLPQMFRVGGAAGLGTLVGGLVGVSLMPVGAAMGLAYLPLHIVHYRRQRDQQGALGRLRVRIDHARSEVPSYFDETLLKIRRTLEGEVQVAVQEREKQLAGAVEQQRQLVHAEEAQRQAARSEARRRLDEVRSLRGRVDQLDRLVSAAS